MMNSCDYFSSLKERKKENQLKIFSSILIRYKEREREIKDES